MRNGLILLTVFFLLALFSGCSLQTSRPVDLPKTLTKMDLDLFAARGFLGGSDYEHYVLKDGLLWRECGSVTPKAELDNLSDARKRSLLQVRQKRLESLTPETQYPIVLAARALHEELKAGEKLPGPESVRSIRDGGVLELRIKGETGEVNILTNVNAVSEPKTKTLEQLKKLFSATRGVGPLICDAQTFFGVGR
jgi:hypothetical protein